MINRPVLKLQKVPNTKPGSLKAFKKVGQCLWILEAPVAPQGIGNLKSPITEGPRLMRLLVLGKNCISQMFVLCNFFAIYFITVICLMQILGFFWPINRSYEIK